MTAREFAELTNEPRSSGNGWITHCPAHDDKTRSLKIDEGQGGRVLLRCFAGCKVDDIVAAVGVTMADIMNGNGEPRTERRSKGGVQTGTLVATYDYENENGTLLYQAVRYNPKDFRQRRPDGTGGWIWNMQGVRRVLFNLPGIRWQLHDDEARAYRHEHGIPDSVFIVEGEKDVHRLAQERLIATTNVGGAGKWRREYSQQLVDAGATSVIVVPDHDAAGLKHAEAIAASCQDVGLIARIVELPGLVEKGDVSDWLQTHNLDDLLQQLAEPAATSWPLAVVLATIVTFIQKYVVLTVNQAIAVALWTVHTHVIDAADATPYMHVTSATKRAGKTRLLEVLEYLVARPWLTGRTSPAALVRKIDAQKSTLLFDESDATFKAAKEFAEALRGILNSGYKRSGRATLCVGKGADISVKDFHTFGAKAIGGIGSLPDTVADRSIPIQLRRRLKSERIQRWRDRDGREEAKPIRQHLVEWASTAIDALEAARPALPTELTDRAQDVWEPLLSIADMAGADWPSTARAAAVALMGTVEDADPTVELLKDLQSLLATTAAGVISTKDIVAHLTDDEDRPWQTWRHGSPLTGRGLARLLGPLGIHPVKYDGGRRGYRTDAFDDAMLRYLPTQVPNGPAPSNDGPTPAGTYDVSPLAKNASATAIQADCTEARALGHIEPGDEDDVAYYGS
jgi:Protein of unknown function (DUF3631)